MTSFNDPLRPVTLFDGYTMSIDHIKWRFYLFQTIFKSTEDCFLFNIEKNTSYVLLLLTILSHFPMIYCLNFALYDMNLNGGAACDFFDNSIFFSFILTFCLAVIISIIICYIRLDYIKNLHLLISPHLHILFLPFINKQFFNSFINICIYVSDDNRGIQILDIIFLLVYCVYTSFTYTLIRCQGVLTHNHSSIFLTFFDESFFHFYYPAYTGQSLLFFWSVHDTCKYRSTVYLILAISSSLMSFFVFICLPSVAFFTQNVLFSKQCTFSAVSIFLFLTNYSTDLASTMDIAHVPLIFLLCFFIGYSLDYEYRNRYQKYLYELDSRDTLTEESIKSIVGNFKLKKLFYTNLIKIGIFSNSRCVKSEVFAHYITSLFPDDDWVTKYLIFLYTFYLKVDDGIYKVFLHKLGESNKSLSAEFAIFHFIYCQMQIADPMSDAIQREIRKFRRYVYRYARAHEKLWSTVPDTAEKMGELIREVGTVFNHTQRQINLMTSMFPFSCHVMFLKSIFLSDLLYDFKEAARSHHNAKEISLNRQSYIRKELICDSHMHFFRAKSFDEYIYPKDMESNQHIFVSVSKFKDVNFIERFEEHLKDYDACFPASWSLKSTKDNILTENSILESHQKGNKKFPIIVFFILLILCIVPPIVIWVIVTNLSYSAKLKQETLLEAADFVTHFYKCWLLTGLTSYKNVFSGYSDELFTNISSQFSELIIKMNNFLINSVFVDYMEELPLSENVYFYKSFTMFMYHFLEVSVSGSTSLVYTQDDERNLDNYTAKIIEISELIQDFYNHTYRSIGSSDKLIHKTSTIYFMIIIIVHIITFHLVYCCHSRSCRQMIEKLLIILRSIPKSVRNLKNDQFTRIKGNPIVDVEYSKLSTSVFIFFVLFFYYLIFNLCVLLIGILYKSDLQSDSLKIPNFNFSYKSLLIEYNYYYVYSNCIYKDETKDLFSVSPDNYLSINTYNSTGKYFYDFINQGTTIFILYLILGLCLIIFFIYKLYSTFQMLDVTARLLCSLTYEQYGANPIFNMPQESNLNDIQKKLNEIQVIKNTEASNFVDEFAIYCHLSIKKQDVTVNFGDLVKLLGFSFSTVEEFITKFKRKKYFIVSMQHFKDIEDFFSRRSTEFPFIFKISVNDFSKFMMRFVTKEDLIITSEIEKKHSHRIYDTIPMIQNVQGGEKVVTGCLVIQTQDDETQKDIKGIIDSYVKLEFELIDDRFKSLHYAYYSKNDEDQTLVNLLDNLYNKGMQYRLCFMFGSELNFSITEFGIVVSGSLYNMVLGYLFKYVKRCFIIPRKLKFESCTSFRVIDKQNDSQNDMIDLFESPIEKISVVNSVLEDKNKLFSIVFKRL